MSYQPPQGPWQQQQPPQWNGQPAEKLDPEHERTVRLGMWLGIGIVVGLLALGILNMVLTAAH
jgi:hypothetical protein